MENYVVVILSGCCSLIAAAVVAIVSGIITRKNQKEEKLNEKRLEIYNEIIIGIDKLISLPNKVFDDEYFATWIKYKGYIKLLASKETIRAYRAFCQYVQDEYSKSVQIKQTDNIQYHRYIVENEPKVKDIETVVNPLINAMRKDIGNRRLN